MIVSIIGTSGVGKSFLVKQLAALDCAPAFFEGEEGVIPDEILQEALTGDNPMPRYQWFCGRIKKMMELAQIISRQSIPCYLDGGPLSPQAIILNENKKFHSKLRPIVESLAGSEPDVYILLTADKDCLKKFISQRSRMTQPTEKSLERSINIQEHFSELAQSKNNVMILDRSNLDFSSARDLELVHSQIHKFIQSRDGKFI